MKIHMEQVQKLLLALEKKSKSSFVYPDDSMYELKDASC